MKDGEGIRGRTAGVQGASRSTIARTAGALYLLFILAMAAANFVGRAGIIVEGDAAATAANILAKGAAFRLGFAADLLSALLFILAAWSLFRLLGDVDKDLAALFLILNACGSVIQCVSMMFLYAALPLLGGALHPAAVPPEQARELAQFFLGLYKDSFTMAQLFFGAWTLPLGYLIFKSGFLPKILGVLMMADCGAVLAWFLQYFFIPGNPRLSYPLWAFSFIAEVSLTLWLLVKGARDQSPAPDHIAETRKEGTK